MSSVVVTKEDENGRNIEFKDVKTGEVMNLETFVSKIKEGNYPDYEVRHLRGVDTPFSRPDGDPSNNLG